MRLPIAVVIAAACLVGGLPLFAAEVPAAQIVVTRMLDQAHGEVIAALDNRPLRLEQSEHPDARWLESKFLTQATRAGKQVVTSQADVVVAIVYNDVSTRYEGVEQADSVRRVITVDVSATIQRDGQLVVVALEPLRDTTVCLRQDALAAESTQHHATHGNMPVPERTVWDDVLEPAIFVVAAVATVVLLFTVRSQ